VKLVDNRGERKDDNCQSHLVSLVGVCIIHR
jgi:hypothetical protein